MKYLSIDIEATGLEPHDLTIEFAAVPIDAATKSIENDLSFHTYIKCPSFEELKPKLTPWIIEHNKELIEKAHSEGVSIDSFRAKLEEYLKSNEIKEYFGSQKIVLFGKSMSSIDLPFLKRDLGHEWMDNHFSHRTLDFTSVCYALADQGVLKPGMESVSPGNVQARVFR